MNTHWRGKTFQKTLLWMFLLCVLLIFCANNPVSAQEDDSIKFSSNVGFDGYCKDGAWIPVQITVANSGPDLSARVHVSYSAFRKDNSTNGADISLPSTSRKNIFLYIYPKNLKQKFNVNLQAGNKLLASIPKRVNCLSNNSLLIGLIAEDPSEYGTLNEIETLSGTVRLAQLQPESMPDQPRGWEALDVLVLGGQDIGVFTPAQQQSMRSWLANGGRLLVIGGLEWQKTTAGLGDLLPVDPKSTHYVESLSALQVYSDTPMSSEASGILAVGHLHPDAEILVEQEGIPLIAQKRFGLGMVYFFAADPGLQPLARWQGMKDVYTYLFAFNTPRPIWSIQDWNSYEANDALSTISELGIPSIFYICGWLAIYVIAVGPVNYLVLRRKKRGELAWLTIPAIVLVFTCVAYFSGYFYRGTRPIMNRFAVVQAWEGFDQAKVRGMIGLYSPNRARYTFEANDHFQFYPFDDTSIQSADGWEMIQTGSTTVLPGVQVEIGGMQAVSVEGMLPAMTFEHDLVLTIDSLWPTLNGIITNTSEFTLKDAILITPGQYKNLGDLPPSKKRGVSLSLGAGRNGPEVYTQDGWEILGKNRYASSINLETARQGEFLSAIFSCSYYYCNSDLPRKMWGIYLMGWVEEPILPVGLQDKRFEQIDTTLYITMLSPSLNIDPESITLPPDMFIWEASREDVSPFYGHLYNTNDKYSIHFRPAIPLHFSEVKALTLHMDTNFVPDDVFVSLWDFGKEEWVHIEITSWGNINIPEPWAYVGFDGEIRLQIGGTKRDYLEIEQSNFTLVVEQ